MIVSGSAKLLKNVTKKFNLGRIQKFSQHVLTIGPGEIVNEAPITGTIQNYSVIVESQQLKVIGIMHQDLKKKKKKLPRHIYFLIKPEENSSLTKF